MVDLFRMELEPRIVWGIVAGVCVFGGTVLTVFVLLLKGGSLERLRLELTSDAVPVQRKRGSQKPRLRDELLVTRKQLKGKAEFREEAVVFGKSVRTKRGPVKKMTLSTTRVGQTNFRSALSAISDGKTKWGLLDPYDPEEEWFLSDPFFGIEENATFVGIFDAQDLVGAIALTHHRPSHLSIRLEFLWLHPAYFDEAASGDLPSLKEPAITKTRRLATLALFGVLHQLFRANYRRVEFLCDTDDAHRRHLATFLGFQLEGILRKHMILNDERSRDSCLYALLNSDWHTGQGDILQRRLGNPTLEFIQTDNQTIPTPPSSSSLLEGAAEKNTTTATLKKNNKKSN